MVWSRRFSYINKESPKRIFYGHTPTSYLQGEEGNFSVWVNDKGDKVCIDGG